MVDIDSGTGITETFLENVLGSKIKSFTVTPGSNDGDNFTSILHSIDVQLENQEKPLYLLLKVYPNHPMRKKFLDDTNLFLKELLVYKSLVPELHKILDRSIGNERHKELTLSLPPLVSGRAIDYAADDFKDNASPTDEISNYLLMVDARKTWGFKMADRRLGLDLEHCKLVMNEIAKIHAMSWNYFVKKGLRRLKDKFPFAVESIFRQDQAELLNGMLAAHFQLMTQALDGSKDLDPEVVKGVMRFKDDPLRCMLLFLKDDGNIDESEVLKYHRMKPQPGSNILHEPWKVGSHGDCWVNNMLFRYCPESGLPLETMLVDLQLFREACPTVDLVYFLYTSTTAEFRKKHLNEVLEYYADSFLHYCKLLEVKPLPGFSCAELKRRFHISKLFGFISGIMLLPMMLQKPEEAPNLDALDLEDDENGEKKLGDMLKSISDKADQNTDLKDRFVALAQELYDDGIL